MNNQLTETAVAQTRQTKWIAHIYHYFPSIGSTNDELKQRVAQGDEITVPQGTVILTDYQSQGKGRLNRKWEAPAQTALLFSVLFRPKWPAERSNWLTMIASLAVTEAIETQTNLTVGIKWPNDVVILIDNVWHKVCGLLLEGNFSENGRLQSAIMGIGVNINISPEDFPEAVTPPTSLRAATGEIVPRLPLFHNILQRLEDHYDMAVAGHSPHDVWNGRLITLNQQVTATNVTTNQSIQGVATGTTPNGELIILDKNNKKHTIVAGDITMRQ